MAHVTRVRRAPALVGLGESDHPQQVAPSRGGTVELIEVETSFGTVAAGEQALIDAVRALLRTEGRTTGPEDDDLAEG